jgi:hypothetical protein
MGLIPVGAGVPSCAVVIAAEVPVESSSRRRNWPQSLKITWWQRGEEELTGAREEMVVSVVRIWERQSAACAARGEFRRQMQGIKAAWKRKYLKIVSRFF